MFRGDIFVHISLREYHQNLSFWYTYHKFILVVYLQLMKMKNTVTFLF